MRRRKKRTKTEGHTNTYRKMPPIHLPQALDADPVLLRQVAPVCKLVRIVAVVRLRLAILEQVKEQRLFMMVGGVGRRDDSRVQLAQVGVCVRRVEG